MTLDEAIEYEEKIVKENKELYRLCPATESEFFHCDGTTDCRTLKDGKNKGCLKCATDHMQIADWLKMLKDIQSTGSCNTCKSRRFKCEYEPEAGQMTRYNCPFYKEERIIKNKESEDNND